MEFVDRKDAAKKLVDLIKEEKIEADIIVSLLRGGAILGDFLANKLQVKHYPLVSVKISSPVNPELAIGAICFDITYMNTKVIKMLNLSNSQLGKQVKLAEKKFMSYCTRFNVDEKRFDNLKDKTVILTDDGVATGSTLLAALDFVKSKDPKEIILALPVAPADFELEGVDKPIIIYKDPSLSAISQYYKSFPQVEDEEIKNLVSLK